MIVTVVRVWVKADCIEPFIEATRQNHLHSIREEGNLRFDVLQQKEHPDQFMLYEAYASHEAAAAHKQTDHYLRWREQVEPWMAQPREGIACDVIEPQEMSGW